MILDRERSRSDRTGRAFSLVVLEVPETSPSLDRIIEVFSGRLRSTDEVGWYQKNLSLLLPDTSPEGAWKLVEDLRRLVKDDGIALECTVFEYPFAKDPSNGNGNGHAHGNGNGNGDENGRGSVVRSRLTIEAQPRSPRFNGGRR